MEDLTAFLESAAAGILFCIAVGILFLQLRLLPGGAFPYGINRFEEAYVRER